MIKMQKINNIHNHKYWAPSPVGKKSRSDSFISLSTGGVFLTKTRLYDTLFDILEVNIRDSDGDRISALFSNSYLWVELQLSLFIFTQQSAIGKVKHHCYKTIKLQQLKIRNIWINQFVVLNVCTRWRCQVIMIVYDVILSSIIALHSVNNNNMVYAFDPLIMPFLSHKGFGNEKNRL